MSSDPSFTDRDVIGKGEEDKLKIYSCDECGYQGRVISLHVTDIETVDFCSMECLREWAMTEAIDGYIAEKAGIRE